MFPIILIGTKDRCDLYIEDFIRSHRLSSYNIISLNEKIKISDVRVIQKKLFLKYEKDEKRLIIFRNSITLDAQHALLKTLEEVAENVYIIIVSQNREDFLPTILSRAKTISLSLENKSLGNKIEDVEKLKKILNEFLESDKKISNSIITTQKILESEDKNEIINKLQQALHELIRDLVNTPSVVEGMNRGKKTSFFRDGNPRSAREDVIHEQIQQGQKSERLSRLVAISHDLLSLTPLIKNNNVNIELSLQQCLESR